MNNNLIKDISFIQEKLELNNRDFSAQLGIARSTVNRWINGSTNISKTQLESLYSFAYSKGLRINELKSQMYLDECNNEEILLFHGAKQYFDGDFNLSYSNQENDFGKAIYLGDNIFQSASWVSNYSDSYIYICKFNDKKLKVLNFNIDENWMLAIAYFRGRLNKYKDYPKMKKIINMFKGVDVVIAPIADNQVYSLLEQFIDGDITDKQCIYSMASTNLGKQYCLLTSKAIKQVSIIDRCYLCLNEKNDYLMKKNTDTENIGEKIKVIKRKYSGKGLYIEDYFK